VCLSDVFFFFFFFNQGSIKLKSFKE